MEALLRRIFPVTIDSNYPGRPFARTIFALIAVISLARGLIHLLAADGGAHSIAGMDLQVAGAGGIVFAFGLWGGSQIVYATIQLVVAFRYRGLIPLMYLLLSVEMALRILVGVIKPVTFARVPPGAIANWVLLPAALVLMAASVATPTREANPRR